MIFALILYGISMDYEVFIITRIRESYRRDARDQSGRISLGLARTGKLVNQRRAVLMFAFFALSTWTGLDIKQFGIGLCGGGHHRCHANPAPTRAVEHAAPRPLELVASSLVRARTSHPAEPVGAIARASGAAQRVFVIA
jgi:hypothetical protein